MLVADTRDHAKYVGLVVRTTEFAVCSDINLGVAP